MSTAARALTATTLAVFALLLAGVPMFLHPDTVYTGVHLHWTGAPIQPDVMAVDRGSPAYDAGLRSSDVAGCLSLRDNNLLFQKEVFTTYPGYVAGTPIQLCVLRNGTWQRFAFTGDRRPPTVSPYYNDFGAALRLSAYALVLLCALTLVLGRPGTMTWLFFFYALFAGPTAPLSANLTTLSPPLYAAIDGLAVFSTALPTSFLLLFTLVVPDDRPLPGWRTTAYRASWFWLIFVAATGIANLLPGFTVSREASGSVIVATSALIVLAVFARLAAMRAQERARFGWAAFAVLLAVVLDVLRQSAILPQSIGAHIALATFLPPAVLLYAVLKRQVIDISFVVSRSVVYAIITTIVVGIIGAVDWATSVYLHQVGVAMALDALVTIGIAFALNRIHRWIEYAVDFVLFRKKYEAETYLHRLARTLANASNEETVHREIVRAPYHRFELAMAAVYRLEAASFVLSAAADASAPAAFDRDHELVRFLTTERERVHLRDLAAETAAQAAVAIPMFQGSDLTGFALYGNHRDGTALDPDEIETLEQLCSAAAQACTLIAYFRYRAMVAPSPAKA